MSKIKLMTGNLLETDVEALVNTVNTVGVMGKGVALQFKQAFPDNFSGYRREFERGDLRIGKMFVFRTGRLANPRYIINFPTKRDWRQKSRLEDIRLGLVDLVEVVKQLEIRSIALPPLGCGNGGLEWGQVRPLIENSLRELVNVEIQLYQPSGAPAASSMPIATSKPRMTPGRAALLGVLGDYIVPGYRLALIEIHKLAYFIQTAGEPLALDFAKDRYGPYAEKLNYVLQRMEGHYIRGYGDRSNKGTEIQVSDEAVIEASKFLNKKPATLGRIDKVRRLIEGYETPYGLELLSTVHWVATRSNLLAQSDVEEAVAGVHKWSKRKQDLFPREHIQLAWNQLKSQGWY